MAAIAASRWMRLRQVWTEQSLIRASAIRFFLMTQVALASRTADWEAALGRHGISLPPEASVFDLTVEVQAAIDRSWQELGRRDRLRERDEEKD